MSRDPRADSWHLSNPIAPSPDWIHPSACLCYLLRMVRTHHKSSCTKQKVQQTRTSLSARKRTRSGCGQTRITGFQEPKHQYYFEDEAEDKPMLKLKCSHIPSHKKHANDVEFWLRSAFEGRQVSVRQWPSMCDWDEQYLTRNNKNDAGQMFYKIYQNLFIYQLCNKMTDILFNIVINVTSSSCQPSLVLYMIWKKKRVCFSCQQFTAIASCVCLVIDKSFLCTTVIIVCRTARKNLE